MERDFYENILKHCNFNTFSIFLDSPLMLLKGQEIKDLKEEEREHSGEPILRHLIFATTSHIQGHVHLNYSH